MNRAPSIPPCLTALGLALLSPVASAQLSSENSRLFMRGTADGFPFAILGRLDVAVPGFGEAMAVGDFNCDDIDDLAIGAPDANANNVVHSGQVVIAYGSPLGLRSNAGIGLSQSSPNMPGGSETGDYFGWAVAAGPLTSDNCDDLVVGTPGEDLETQANAGSLTFLYGRTTGLIGQGAFNLPAFNDYVMYDDYFGSALAIANVFSAPGTLSELIIGVPKAQRVPNAFPPWEKAPEGRIDLYGAENSMPLQRALGRGFHPDPTTDTQFGAALAVGNFDGDGLPDVAVGAPGLDVVEFTGNGGFNYHTDVGGVSILYGGVSYPSLADWHHFDQDSPGVPGDSLQHDRFGSVLAAGDFDADGDDDLVIGIPRKRGSVEGNVTGALIVRNGRSDGVNGFESTRSWTNAQVGLPTNASGNKFASALAVGDFNADGYADLAAGAPGVNVSGVVDSGAVVVLYGSADGLSLAGRQIWHKGSPGIPGSLGVNEGFGAGLAAGDFNGDGADDLIVAIPQQILSSTGTPRGGVLVIYGNHAVAPNDTIFADGFEP